MNLADEILRAATLLSGHLHELDARDLLHHRQELQLAFDSLGRVLRLSPQNSHVSGLLNPINSTASSQPISRHNRQERLAVAHALPSAPLQQSEPSASLQQPEHSAPLQQPEPSAPLQQPGHSASLHRAAGSKTSNIQDCITGGDSQEILPSPREIQENEVSLFMDKLEIHSKAIQSFLNLKEGDAISKGKNWMCQDDPLDIDIEMSEKPISPSQKFRGWLARYIRAEDYLAWAEAKYGRPRNEFLTFEPKDAHKKGHISEYMAFKEFNRSRSAKVRKSIKNGLKYHTFEQIYGNLGVFSFLSQMHCAFRDLPYTHLSSLARAIQKSPRWSPFAVSKAHWVTNCRSLYNKECGEANIPILAVSKLT